MSKSAKEKAKLLLIKRINDFKPEFESMEQVIDEVIEEMWDLFDDDLINSVTHTTNADQTTNCKGIQIYGKRRH